MKEGIFLTNDFMIQGLYYQLATKNLLLAKARAIIADPEAGAGQVHDAEVNAGILSRELVDLEYQIHEDIKFVGEQQKFINFLTATKYKTANRMLALRHCEDAQSRILRELGDKPTN